MRKLFWVAFVVTLSINPLLVLAQNDFNQDDARALSSEAERKTIEEPITVATVNIRDANIKKQNNNILNISFALTNRVGIQPQVRYAVDILEVQKNGLQILVDRKVYNETLSLNEGERIEKEITYTAPEYFNGTYQVWIVSMNEQSMLFAQALAGEVSFSGSGEIVSVDQDTCRVFVSDKLDEYFIDQGVDISKEESLKLACAVTNNTKSAISVTPHFRTHYRSSLGIIMGEENSNDIIALKSKERKNVSIALPIVSEPQAYDVVVFFTDASGKQISSAVNIHYVLRGASATIQSVILDKDYYVKNDIARVSLFWTGAADAFPNARGKGTTIGSVNISAVISSAVGKECGRTLNKEDIGGALKIDVPIVADCVNPKVLLSVTDESGKVLAQSQFKVQTKKQINAVGREDQNKDDIERESIFVIAALIVSLLFVIAFFFYQKRKSNASVRLLTLVFLLLGLLFASNTAHADTFFVGYDGVFTVNLDKDTYAPGEIIRVTGSGHGGYCSNGRQFLSLYTWNNQPPQVILPGIDDSGPKYGDPNNPSDPLMFRNHSYKVQTLYNTKNFRAPSTIGSYQVSFTGTGRTDVSWWPGGHGPLTSGFYYLPYSVVVAPIDGVCNPLTNGVATPTKPTTNLCLTTFGNSPVAGTGPWTWTCNGSNGGTNVPCNAPLIPLIVNGACNSLTDGIATTTAPTTNLCSAGSASVVSGTGPWVWTCNGSGGGGYASCSAPSSVVCTPTDWVDGPCQCPQETRTRSNGCQTETDIECDAAGKNSCRDFNFREVAP